MSSKKYVLYLSIVEVFGVIILSILSIFIGYPLTQIFPILEDGFGLVPAISGIIVGTFLVGFIYIVLSKRSLLLLLFVGLISSSILSVWSTKILISDLYTPFKEIRSVLFWHTFPLFTGLISGFLVRLVFYKMTKESRVLMQGTEESERRCDS